MRRGRKRKRKRKGISHVPSYGPSSLPTKSGPQISLPISQPALVHTVSSTQPNPTPITYISQHTTLLNHYPSTHPLTPDPSLINSSNTNPTCSRPQPLTIPFQPNLALFEPNPSPFSSSPIPILDSSSATRAPFVSYSSSPSSPTQTTHPMQNP